MRTIARLSLLALVVAFLPGCAVVDVASTAVSVTATAVSTAADVGGAVVSTAADTVSGSSDKKDDDKKSD